MSDRIAAACGELGESLVPDGVMSRAIADHLVPEIRVEQSVKSVGWQQRVQSGVEPHSGDFTQQKRAQLQRGDPAGKTVSPRLDPQRRPAGDDDVHGVVIYQGLDLRGPGGEVLYLIEKKVCRLSRVGRLVQRGAKNAVLVPTDDGEDGFLDLEEAGDFIKLHAENSLWFEGSRMKKLFDRLLLKRGLADLTRPGKITTGAIPPSNFRSSAENAQRR